MDQPPKNLLQKVKEALVYKPENDPFFGLKYLAYCRSTLPSSDVDLTEEGLQVFAKWQLCKARNVLWNDPIWDSYTMQELLIEFFAIRFDESDELRTEFGASLNTAKKADIDWMEASAIKLKAELAAKAAKDVKIEEALSLPEPEDFEDKY